MGKPTPDERLIGVRFPVGPPTWTRSLTARQQTFNLKSVSSSLTGFPNPLLAQRTELKVTNLRVGSSNLSQGSNNRPEA
jgi:hypothetical protein